MNRENKKSDMKRDIIKHIHVQTVLYAKFVDD